VLQRDSGRSNVNRVNLSYPVRRRPLTNSPIQLINQRSSLGSDDRGAGGIWAKPPRRIQRTSERIVCRRSCGVELAQRASAEYQHANNRLGDWFRESGRRRALERYDV
jgi:hypothetical protein